MVTTTRRTKLGHNDTGWPSGVSYTIGHEGCERFSFYGMKSILFGIRAYSYAGTENTQ